MRYVPSPYVVDWPWFTQLVTGPPKDRTIICDIMNAIGLDDQHMLRFRAFEQLDTLEYLGFTTVLSELDARVALDPASKKIVSPVIDFCVPLMQGISNRPSRRVPLAGLNRVPLVCLQPVPSVAEPALRGSIY